MWSLMELTGEVVLSVISLISDYYCGGCAPKSEMPPQKTIYESEK